SFWFGNDYPQNSLIYERNANLTGLAKLDSAYNPPPNGGWFNIFANVTNKTETLMIQLFTQFQTQAWGITSTSSPELDAILGERPEQPMISSRSDVIRLIAALNNTSPVAPFLSSPASPGSPYGLLGAMEGRYFYNVSQSSRSNATLEGLQAVPFFATAASLEGRQTRVTPSEMDDILASRIRTLIQSLSELNKTVLFKRGPSAAEITAFNIQAGKVTKMMPYGGLYLDAFSREELRAKVMMQVGNDKRISSSATYPTQGKRQMIFLTQISQALLKAFGVGETAMITQGLRIFPQVQTTKIDISFGGVIGRILYPFGVSFLLPIFVIMLVKEKEERIWAYYLTNYVTFYILFAASTIVFLLAGRFSRLEFFTVTQPAVLIILFFLWGHVQIALAFFFASLFSKSRIALVMTFLIVLCGVIISLVLERLFSEDQIPSAIFLWPPFAFYRALGLINKSSLSKNLPAYRLSMLKRGDEVFTATMFLVLGFFVYGLLAIYFSAVIPSEFGVRQPWHFPITAPIEELKRRQRIR
ncbi:hypothetical protein HDU67_002717, partial [Dinochytrium kinnereticum]